MFSKLRYLTTKKVIGIKFSDKIPKIESNLINDNPPIQINEDKIINYIYNQRYKIIAAIFIVDKIHQFLKIDGIERKIIDNENSIYIILHSIHQFLKIDGIERNNK